MSEREAAAERLAQCEAAYRRAQRGTCPVRYRTAWAALVEAERAVVALEALTPEPPVADMELPRRAMTVANW